MFVPEPRNPGTQEPRNLGTLALPAHVHRFRSKGEKDAKAEAGTAAVDRLEISWDHSHRDGAAEAARHPLRAGSMYE